MATLTTFTNVQATENVYTGTTVSTVSTAGAVTYTTTQIRGGLILRDPNGAGRTDILPGADAVFVAMGNPVKSTGISFEFTIRNTADAAETITIGGTPTGVTYSGTMTIAQNNTKSFLWVQNTPTTATVYSLGTVVH